MEPLAFPQDAGKCAVQEGVAREAVREQYGGRIERKWRCSRSKAQLHRPSSCRDTQDGLAQSALCECLGHDATVAQRFITDPDGLREFSYCKNYKQGQG